MTTLEQVIAAVQTLPPEDRRSLRQWLQEQEQSDADAQLRAETPLIVETGRGPCIAGRRTTLYVVYQTFIATQDREFVKRHLLLTDEQLDAALEYIEQHKEQFLRDYAEIVRVSEERREHYNQIFRERSPFPPDLPMEERVKLMREELRRRKETASTTASSSSGSPSDGH